LLVSPAIVLSATADWRTDRARVVEGAMLALATAATAALMFGGVLALSLAHYPISFLVFPVLVWGAFRFGPRGAALVALESAGFALWGTLNGFGPYGSGSPNEALVLLQAFMAVAALTSLTLGAAVLDRQRTEARLLSIEQRSRVVAEDAARIREEFLSVATHELRTPLTSLTGYAQLAKRAHALAQHGRLGPAIDSIVRQAERLAALITNLLDASRVQTGQLDMHPALTELSVTTENTVEASRLVDGGRHRWQVRIDPDLHAVIDPLRWEQLVVNLLDNGMKYSPAGRTITVRLRRDGGGPIALEVSDDGMGIAADRIGHIFDRFYRAHHDQGLGGLGLGLYIAREIATRHGGDIAVRSAEHQGTTFTVTLPAAPSAPPVAATDDGTRTADHDAQSLGRILVVDDDNDLRNLVETVLRDEGFDVMTAHHGEEALALATRQRPDLILLDKLMPVMDGSAFARAYRDAVSDPSPIVAFCAARDAADWARDIGAVDHLDKPFDVEALDRAVRKVLSHQPPTAV
ncbi:MAG TPA: hybrid sensor histidine kinase/response regulator, partial [Candidatus Limnocylindria bacterium]|nr:hybrid sensor histidine kinase/response regulator [Candidatus Limnocylindria bacterium]